MSKHFTGYKGLNDAQVKASREKHGSNIIAFKKKNGFTDALKSLLKEPMILLLLIAASLYFIIGDYGDGIFMIAAIILVSGISLYQDKRSRNALEKLKIFSMAGCTVIRNGKEALIHSDEVVVGDLLQVSEGELIEADGRIIRSNDFSVNESMLTGESLPVFKDAEQKEPMIFKGTTVASGLAIAEVTAIGNATELGKIGKSLENIQEEETPLEKQVSNFVKKMVLIGAVVFVVVWIFNYLSSGDMADSLLKSLTLAMSILPEEIPVAFTTFMALGAYRLMKMGIVVKQMKTVETLGSATVICTDKTGTITENEMRLARLHLPHQQAPLEINGELPPEARDLVRMAMWASEPIPFDPMEVSLHEAYQTSTRKDERAGAKMIHEYPLGGKPPMMTHVFELEDGNQVIAAKGAPEAILHVSGLDEEEKEKMSNAFRAMSKDGYRVLGVAHAPSYSDRLPKAQQDLPFELVGLVGFYDPPKKNMQNVLQAFYNAGIEVKIITGDNKNTTAAIAREIEFAGGENTVSGDEIMHLDDEALKTVAREKSIFSRMFPEAKLRIINALKEQGEIVAMTGDGVNDGPALKAAHIGIAMGKRGTEIARQAASLILVDDDFSKMVDAVAMGRKIYANLKKAIQYIISIHIPIILTVFFPLVLGWIYPNIFTPVHVIFFELIMGPTCSIIYENEPIEKNSMQEPPRLYSDTFFSWNELTTSIIQGLAITAGTLTIYQWAVGQGESESVTRTLVFLTMISANIFLTFVNRSFYYSILKTFTYRNNLIPLIVLATLLITALLLIVPPFRNFFLFDLVTPKQIGMSVGAGFLSVIWYEGVKLAKRIKSERKF